MLFKVFFFFFTIKVFVLQNRCSFKEILEKSVLAIRKMKGPLIFLSSILAGEDGQIDISEVFCFLTEIE